MARITRGGANIICLLFAIESALMPSVALAARFGNIVLQGRLYGYALGVKVKITHLWDEWLSAHVFLFLLTASKMDGRSAKEIGDELSRLLKEGIESVKRQSFVPLDVEEMRQQEERLKRIRELSADYLIALRSLARR